MPAAYFALKGTEGRTAQPGSEINGPIREHTPLGLKCCHVSTVNGRKGQTRHLPSLPDQLSLAQPRLFFLASAGQRKRQCPCLFWGAVFMTFFPQLFSEICFNFNFRRIEDFRFQWGRFRSLKSQNPGVNSGNSQNRVSVSR